MLLERYLEEGVGVAWRKRQGEFTFGSGHVKNKTFM